MWNEWRLSKIFLLNSILIRQSSMIYKDLEYAIKSGEKNTEKTQNLVLLINKHQKKQQEHKPKNCFKIK